MMRTILAVLAAIVSATVPAAAVDAMPAKFRGTWASMTSVKDVKDDVLVISAKTIQPNGRGPACSLTNVMPANEEFTAVVITWRCPESPKARPTEMTLKL